MLPRTYCLMRRCDPFLLLLIIVTTVTYVLRIGGLDQTLGLKPSNPKHFSLPCPNVEMDTVSFNTKQGRITTIHVC